MGNARLSALSMYPIPPTEKLTVTEFEDFAYDRLRRAWPGLESSAPRGPPPSPLDACAPCPSSRPIAVLSSIDMAKAKGFKGKQMNDKIRDYRDKYMPLTPAGLRKDLYSHFILRLAYCQTEDLRRWFLQNETELFKWRFANNPPEDISAWLASNGLRYEAISKDEVITHMSKLKEVTRHWLSGLAEAQQAA